MPITLMDELRPDASSRPAETGHARTHPFYHGCVEFQSAAKDGKRCVQVHVESDFTRQEVEMDGIGQSE